MFFWLTVSRTGKLIDAGADSVNVSTDCGAMSADIPAATQGRKT
jgi:hypothetical protein